MRVESLLNGSNAVSRLFVMSAYIENLFCTSASDARASFKSALRDETLSSVFEGL